MEPLKWGCRGLGGVRDVRGEWGVVGVWGVLSGEWKATNMGPYLPIKIMHASQYTVWYGIGRMVH